MDLNFLRSFRAGSDQPLGGRYKIVEQLGAGGFGQTFRAQDLHLPGHPLCVIKQLKPQVEDVQGLQVARRLFDTEAKVLYRLGSHGQIPHLLAHFEENREFYLAQELIEGHSLADEFETVPWDVAKVIDFLGDVLGTLAFVHEHRVIHRDLKPSNLIRRNSDGRIVMIDFGAVKQVGTQPATVGAGISHTISIGTQGYMPSEQLAGQPQFSSDIYAVGIMGIQALTGQSPKYLMPHSQTGEIDWHSHINQNIAQRHPDLVALLDTMVRYDFRSRYTSAKTALAALRSLPADLEQYIPVTESVRNEVAQSGAIAAPSIPPKPTELTVPAMGQQPPSVSRKSAMATEVVARPSPRRTLPIPGLIIGSVFLATGLLIGRACTSKTPNNVQNTVAQDPPALVTTPTTTSPAASVPAKPNPVNPTETVPTNTPPADNRPIDPSSSAASIPINPAPVNPIETVPTETSPVVPPRPVSPATPAASTPVSPAPTNPDETVPTETPPTETPPANISPVPPTVTPTDVVETVIETDNAAANLTPAIAQTAVAAFYNHISSQAWNEAQAQTGGDLARLFNPSFFQQFQQVSIENLRVTDQTQETIKLLGQNTYLYSDGSTQQEERTYTVQLVNGQPRIIASDFVRVTKSR